LGLQVYHNATVVTMDAKRRIFEKGALAVSGTRILDVGREEEVLSKYGNAKRIDVEGDILLPGLINSHMHLAQTMIRGLADDLPLTTWLGERIWAIQASYSAEEAKTSAELGIAEMLLSGTTTFVESMIAHNYGIDGIAEAVESSGIRAALSKVVMEPLQGTILPDGLRETKEGSFEEARSAHERWHGKNDGRIMVWLGPRWTGSFNPPLLETVKRTMDELGMRATMHFAESTEDVEAIRKETGLTSVEFLEKMGLARPEMLLVHCVCLEDKDIDILAQTGISVAHCPVSNMKIGMGYCRVLDLIDKGVNVTIGSDAAACNNNCDVFLDMKEAAMLHKHENRSSTALPAERVLEMVTINAARAMGLEDEIGSLEPGKKADFIVVDIHKPWLTPSPNPVSTLVYTATGQDVKMVVVNGEIVVQDRNLLTMDVPSLLDKTARTVERIMARIGIKRTDLPSWPIIGD
jgi:cytosine/adenosine deaminase-related metal-dependent hydrolase